MRRLSWRVTTVLCLVYAITVVGVTLWRLTALAESAARREGFGAEDTYVILPSPPAWWLALLLVPPGVLIFGRTPQGRRP